MTAPHPSAAPPTPTPALSARTEAAHVAVVGIGPRGLSVLERLCADRRLRPQARRLVVHVVDPHLPGAGSVWRTSQAPELLMNTVAAQVTIFTDRSVTIEGPIVPGPSLYEWAHHVTTVDVLNTLRLPAEVRAEAAALGPDTYPSRSFYGQYLCWAFQRIVEAAAPGVEVSYHALSAVALDDDGDGGHQRLTLEDGSWIGDLHAVVLAQGHTGETLTEEQEADRAFAERNGGVYLPPTNPADADLSGIPAGQAVLVRGMGLAYFDYQALLTEGRGGRFETDPVEGVLRYVPSGREPRLVVGSRRGVPHHSRGANQKEPHERHRPLVLTPERIAGLTERAQRVGDVDFHRDIWPLVSLEVELTYYGKTVGDLDGERRTQFLRRYGDAVDPGDRTAVLDAFDVPDGLRWRWSLLERPYQDRAFADRSEFRSWLAEYLDQDVEAARAGNVEGPLKAALDVLRDLRNEVRLLVDHGGVRGGSYAQDLQRWFTPFNAFLSIGPPLRRIEELGALMQAGVVEVVGPQMTVRRNEDCGRFAATSMVPGPTEYARSLIEARLPEVDLTRTTDPLMTYLLSTGACRAYRIPDPLEGGDVEFGGLTVTQAPYQLVDAEGRAHPRRFAYGVPTESVHWASAAGVRPGVNSVTLSDSDAIARAVVDLCTETREATPARVQDLRQVS